MTIRAGKIISLFIAAAAISGCLFWQSPLLSAPSDADALAARHNVAGIQAYKQEQWDRGNEHFEAAVKIAPSLAEAHYNLGLALYRLGALREGDTHFIKPANLAPGNKVIWNAPPLSNVTVHEKNVTKPGSDGQGHSH